MIVKDVADGFSAHDSFDEVRHGDIIMINLPAEYGRDAYPGGGKRPGNFLKKGESLKLIIVIVCLIIDNLLKNIRLKRIQDDVDDVFL